MGNQAMTRVFLKDLCDHMEWADATVWQTVVNIEEHPDDGNLRELLFHLHSVQQVFLDVWTGKEVTTPDPASFTDLRDMLAWAKKYYTAVFAFLNDLPEDRFEESLPIPWARLFEKHIGHPAGTTTLAETMFQVVLHSTYHRGQINRRIKELGGKPPLVDYIVWLWRGRPESAWPV